MKELLKKELKEFYPFVKKWLGLTNTITFKFLEDSDNLKQGVVGYTAYYNPDKKNVTVYIDGRDIKDVLKSIAHELVHARQDQDGLFADKIASEGYAQNDQELRKLEEEAYKDGGLIFRDYQDMKRKKIKEGNNEMADKKEEKDIPKSDNRKFMEEINENQKLIDWAQKQRNERLAKKMAKLFNIKNWD